MPRVFICIRRAGALALALLLAVGLPLLRMAHEAEHQQHQLHQQQLVVDAGLAPGTAAAVASSPSEDDECGPCAICQLLLVVAAQHAVPLAALSLPPPALPQMATTLPPAEAWCPSTGSRQPPARGPPAAVVLVEPPGRTA